jgi:crossover junction endodeoxyribonuclease RusA
MTQSVIPVDQPAVLVDVFVPGRPAPQGSKRYLGQHGGKGITVEMSKKVAPWRTDIRDALCARGTWCRIDAARPVAVQLQFVMPRPASAPKRRTPPAVKRPDLDKLVRAVLDAIGSAGIWHDDSQVVDLRATKRLAELAEPAGCHITIQEAR